MRGAQLYFAGGLKTGNLSIPGVEVRAEGAYVLAPGSIHPSGVEYSGSLPKAAELWEVPDGIADLLASQAASNEPAPPVEGKIPPGVQHNSLVSFAGTMRRRGADAATIAAALKVMNATRCEVPGTDDAMDKIAESMMAYDPSDVPWKSNGTSPAADTSATDGHIFVTVQGDPEEIRQPRFAWEGRVLLGAWNVLVGSGGVGKGLLIAWLVAGWSRGGLPGHFQSQPIDILIVADEDSRHDTWDPRIMSAGGDLSRVHYLAYAPGTSAE